MIIVAEQSLPAELKKPRQLEESFGEKGIKELVLSGGSLRKNCPGRIARK